MTSRAIWVACLIYCFALGATANPERSIDASIFTHFEVYGSSSGSTHDSFTLGETALFATGQLSDRFSFLAEGTYQQSRYRDDPSSLERIQVRYELDRDNWLSVGKMHTPVNYWNDTYHHGRLFFPTINRPLFFKSFVPIHEVGVRLGGADLFGSGIGYDFVLGSGQSVGDEFFTKGVKATSFSLNWSPNKQLYLMASYYRDEGSDGHSSSHHNHGEIGQQSADPHLGRGYQMLSFSANWQGGKWSSITELAVNREKHGSNNYAAFQYLGYDITDRWTLYGLFDHVDVIEQAVRFEAGQDTRVGLGSKFDFNTNTTFKLEAVRRLQNTHHSDYHNVIEAQVAIGF